MSGDDEGSEQAPDASEESTEEVVELTLEEQLSAAQLEAEKSRQEIVYKIADLDNMRKRHAQERVELMKFGGRRLAERFVTLLDDFDRAFAALPEGGDEVVYEGFQMIRNNMESALIAEGASVISAEGEVFDPERMQAVSTIPASEEYPENTVVSVLETGWMLHDRVLRAAMVVVTSAE